MKAANATRVKELERENARLKRIVADEELEVDALRKICRESVSPLSIEI